MALDMCSVQKRRYFKLLSRGYSTDEAFELSTSSDLDKVVELRKPKKLVSLEKTRRMAITAKPRREKIQLLRSGKPKEKRSSIMVKTEPGTSTVRKKCVTFLLPSQSGLKKSNSKQTRTRLMSGSRRKRYKWFVTHGYSPEVAFVLSAKTLSWPNNKTVKSENTDNGDCGSGQNEQENSELTFSSDSNIKTENEPSSAEENNQQEASKEVNLDSQMETEDVYTISKMQENSIDSSDSGLVSPCSTCDMEINDDKQPPMPRNYGTELMNTENEKISKLVNGGSGLPLGILKCIKWLVSNGHIEEDVIAMYFNLALKHAISSQRITIGKELCFSLQIAESGNDSTVLEVVGSDMKFDDDSSNSGMSWEEMSNIKETPQSPSSQASSDDVCSKENSSGATQDLAETNDPDENNKKSSDCPTNSEDSSKNQSTQSNCENNNSEKKTDDKTGEDDSTSKLDVTSEDQESIEEIRVGILHSDFPSVTLTKDELCILEFFILQEVLKEAEVKPRFRGITHMQDYLLLVCINKETSDWLWKNVPSWKPWHGATLKIVDEKSFPVVKGVYDSRRGIFESTKKIRDYLKAQNPNDLNIDSWVFFDRKDFDTSIQLTFGIDPKLADRLNKGKESLCYKFNQVPFRIDDLEHAEFYKRLRRMRNAANLAMNNK